MQTGMQTRKLLAYVVALSSISWGCAALKKVPGGADAVGAAGSLADAKGASAGPGSSNSVAIAPSEPMKVSEDAPRDAQGAINQLNYFQRTLEEGDARMLGMAHEKAFMSVIGDPGDELKAWSGFGDLKKKFNELEQAAAKAAGGVALEAIGDGTRTASADEDALEAIVEAVGECKSVAREDFLKKYARAKKMDEKAIHYFALKGGTITDIPGDIVACEYQWKAEANADADTYKSEGSIAKDFTTCGYNYYRFRALKIGGNKYGSYAITGVPSDSTNAMPCAKLPKKTKLDAPILKAVKAEFPDLNKVKGGVVIQQEGKFEYEQEDRAIYRVATVRLYSHEVQLRTNECGDTGDKIVCEASGSNTAAHHNLAKFYLARAEFHRGAKDREKCKSMLKDAMKEAEKFTEMHERSVKNDEWRKGLTYLVGGKKLTEKQIIETITGMGKTADDRLMNKWCEGS